MRCFTFRPHRRNFYRAHENTLIKLLITKGKVKISQVMSRVLGYLPIISKDRVFQFKKFQIANFEKSLYLVTIYPTITINVAIN